MKQRKIDEEKDQKKDKGRKERKCKSKCIVNKNCDLMAERSHRSKTSKNGMIFWYELLSFILPLSCWNSFFRDAL